MISEIPPPVKKKRIYTPEQMHRVYLRALKWKKENPEKVRQSNATYRRSNKDKIQLSGKIYRLKNLEKERLRSRKYYTNNKEKESKRKAQAYKSNRDKFLAQRKDYYYRTVEFQRKRRRLYYQNHKEQRRIYYSNYYSNNKEKALACRRRWAKNNPHMVLANVYRRIARKKTNSTEEQIKSANEKIKQLKKLKSFQCTYCGRKFQAKDMEIDHVIPLKKHGPHAAQNIVPSCQSCNHRKSAKELGKEWIPPQLPFNFLLQ